MICDGDLTKGICDLGKMMGDLVQGFGMYCRDCWSFGDDGRWGENGFELMWGTPWGVWSGEMSGRGWYTSGIGHI